jgi:hypothetical protein
MQRNHFINVLFRSPLFIMLVIVLILVFLALFYSLRKDKVVQMQEDVIYVSPKN